MHSVNGEFIPTGELCEPTLSALCRPLDPSHVVKLKEAIRIDPILTHSIMLGHTEDTDVTRIKNGTAKVEIIGGNHTRQAIQELLADDSLPASLKQKLAKWPCKVYNGLHPRQKLYLAIQHNTANENIKLMLYEDVCFLMRQEWHKTCALGLSDKDRDNIWRTSLCSLLRLTVSFKPLDINVSSLIENNLPLRQIFHICSLK